MSWLSETFSSPTNAIHQVLDPVGSAIGATKGVDWGNSDSMNLESNTRNGQGDTAVAPAPVAPPPIPGQGDSSDPAYGSFAQPFDVEQFYKYQDPGYAWRLQQGQQGVLNGAASRDGALSGAALKDLMDYNQGQASTEYGNAFNRYQTTQGNIFSRLSSLAGLGQASAANVGAQGTALAGQAGQAIQNAGTAAGAGIVGAGNALAGGASNYAGYQYANTPRMVSANPTTGIADNYQAPVNAGLV